MELRQQLNSAQFYPWFSMLPAVHRALFHAHLVVENNYFHGIPIGALTEEAGESVNKLLKRARLFHARKNSRLNTMTDLFRNRLVASDPCIAQINLKKRFSLRLAIRSVKPAKK
eukprot:Pompholyxophrys_punicea_v1_NODE_1532_length_658_cov_2.547264.p1 type:complete len:114 gc:universal NODE_1532_length_658_cov_2.547264:82-423(+)